MNGPVVQVPTSEQRLEYERRKKFDYASLCVQVINVLATAVEKGIAVPHRDDCLQQASKNLLNWLNRSAEEF